MTTTKMQLLNSYLNGNVNVEIYSDGTKIRKYKGVAQPIFPESIDVKITNYCDAGCAFCHEKSNIKGQHADLNKLLKVIKDLPAGIELAVGGGNSLSHPDINNFLTVLKQKNIISNITINQKHIKPYKEHITYLLKNDLIKGLGISYGAKNYLQDIEPLLQVSDNIVFHLIMGVNNINDVAELNNFCIERNKQCKILVLGYKQFGFGVNYYLRNPQIENNKYRWYVELAKYFKQDNLTISFDNLAIEQLKLQRYFTKEAWDKFYMGDDFVFTMYMDAVNQHYAPSSTSSNRVSFDDMSLIDYFRKFRKNEIK